MEIIFGVWGVLWSFTILQKLKNNLKFIILRVQYGVDWKLEEHPFLDLELEKILVNGKETRLITSDSCYQP